MTAALNEDEVTTVIVRGLPRSVCGVRDYALRLTEELGQQIGLRVGFVVGDLEWRGADRVAGFAVARLESDDAAGLRRVLGERGVSCFTMVTMDITLGACPGGSRMASASGEPTLVTRD